MNETRWFLLIGTAITLLFALSLYWMGVRGDASNSTYVCVNPTGQMRVIPPDTVCYPDERVVEWGISGGVVAREPRGTHGPVNYHAQPVSAK